MLDSKIMLDCHFNLDVGDYLKELNKIECSTFEEKENSFRKSIAGRKINFGNFCCKGNINLREKVLIIKYFL